MADVFRDADDKWVDTVGDFWDSSSSSESSSSSSSE
ncbi:unnamed protein product, partial [marine sediment metagenome]